MNTVSQCNEMKRCSSYSTKTTDHLSEAWEHFRAKIFVEHQSLNTQMSLQQCKRINLDSTYWNKDSYEICKNNGYLQDPENPKVSCKAHNSKDSTTQVRASSPYLILNLTEGTYRGEVIRDGEILDFESDKKLSLSDFKLGHGVLTVCDGTSQYGNWSSKREITVGSIYSATFHYEGEIVDSVACGCGIGFWSFGMLYIGEWQNGRPCGLGCLQDLHNITTIHDEIENDLRQRTHISMLGGGTFGWFNGTICQIKVTHPRSARETTNDIAKRTRQTLRQIRNQLPSQFQEQPKRGLYIACIILEQARIRLFGKYISAWQWFTCQRSIFRARNCRQQAIDSSKLALVAQQKAVNEHLRAHAVQYTQEYKQLADRVIVARAEHDRVQKLCKFYSNRTSHLQFESGVATSCVDRNQEVIEAMEKSLSDLKAKVNKANTAKLEEESLSVKLTCAREQIQLLVEDIEHHKRAAYGNNELTMNMVQKSSKNNRKCNTPGYVKQFWKKHKVVVDSSDIKDSQYICGIPRCPCRLTQDVFHNLKCCNNYKK